MHEKESNVSERAPTTAGTPLSEQELEEAIEHELAMTKESMHRTSVPEKAAPEPAPIELHDERPTPPTAELEPDAYCIQLGDATVEYGRPIDEIKKKSLAVYGGLGVLWMPTRVKAWRLRERITQKEIIARVTPEGTVRIIDGNTTLYAALQCGIDPSELKVAYSLSPTWHDTGPEYHHETLADLIERVATLERREDDGV